MSRRLLILLLAAHVVAISLAAIPNPQELPAIGRSPIRADDALAARLAPPADAAAEAVVEWSRRLWRLTGPLRVLTSPYVNLTAQHQRWHMFSGPLTVNEYVRARYFVAGDGPAVGASWVATEVIFPSHPTNWWHVFESFRNSFRDKAIMTALTDFRSHFPIAPETGIPPDDLAPVATYFAATFARRLPPGERVIRTEIWYGREPLSPPGDYPSDLSRPPDAALTEQHIDIPAFAPPFGREREGPISWVMFYDRR